MSSDLKFSKALAGNTDLITAQAFFFSQEIELDGVSGEISLGLIISSLGEDAFTKTRTAALIAEDNFFSSTGPLHHRISSLHDFFLQELSDLENIQILFALFQKNQLYLYSFGTHQAFLKSEQGIKALTPQESYPLILNLGANEKLLFISAREIDSSNSPRTLSVQGSLLATSNSQLAASSQELENSSLIWQEDFIQSLLGEEIEFLEEQVESFLKSETHPDPLAAILIESPKEAPLGSQETSVDQEELPPELDQQEIKPILNTPYGEIPGLPLSIPDISLPKQNLITLFLSSKKIFIPILGFLILFALISLGLFFNYQSQQGKKTQVKSLLNEAQQKYNQAQALKDSDQPQAQQNLIEANQTLNQALKISPQDGEAKKLKELISQNAASILKLYQITDFPLFLSLDLIKQGFSTKHLSFSLGKLLLLDQKQKTLVALDLSSKKPQLLAGSVQLGQAEYASINGADVYVYSLDKGVLHINLDTGKVTQAVKPDSEWGNIADIYAFAGNLYLLDSIKNQIWKYTPIKSGFSDKITYLQDNSKLNFQGAKRMQVDFSVWVLKDGPEIYKFTGGYEDPFSVGGLDTPLQELNSFYPLEGEDQVFFLDSQNSRLISFKKNGPYLSQYKGDLFKTAEDFVIDQENKKIYLLNGSKLYQVELR